MSRARRETRHLWVGNLPERISTDRIQIYFQRYGKVQNVKILTQSGGANNKEEYGGRNGGTCATVAFMDLKSAAKAHGSENRLDDRLLETDYYEPTLSISLDGAHKPQTQVFYHEKDEYVHHPTTPQPAGPPTLSLRSSSVAAPSISSVVVPPNSSLSGKTGSLGRSLSSTVVGSYTGPNTSRQFCDEVEPFGEEMRLLTSSVTSRERSIEHRDSRDRLSERDIRSDRNERDRDRTRERTDSRSDRDRDSDRDTQLAASRTTDLRARISGAYRERESGGSASPPLSSSRRLLTSSPKGHDVRSSHHIDRDRYADTTPARRNSQSESNSYNMTSSGGSGLGYGADSNTKRYNNSSDQFYRDHHGGSGSLNSVGSSGSFRANKLTSSETDIHTSSVSPPQPHLVRPIGRSSSSGFTYPSSAVSVVSSHYSNNPLSSASSNQLVASPCSVPSPSHSQHSQSGSQHHGHHKRPLSMFPSSLSPGRSPSPTTGADSIDSTDLTTASATITSNSAQSLISHYPTHAPTTHQHSTSFTPHEHSSPSLASVAASWRSGSVKSSVVATALPMQSSTASSSASAEMISDNANVHLKRHNKSASDLHYSSSSCSQQQPLSTNCVVAPLTGNSLASCVGDSNNSSNSNNNTGHLERKKRLLGVVEPLNVNRERAIVAPIGQALPIGLASAMPATATVPPLGASSLAADLLRAGTSSSMTVSDAELALSPEKIQQQLLSIISRAKATNDDEEKKKTLLSLVSKFATASSAEAVIAAAVTDDHETPAIFSATHHTVTHHPHTNSPVVHHTHHHTVHHSINTTGHPHGHRVKSSHSLSGHLSKHGLKSSSSSSSIHKSSHHHKAEVIPLEAPDGNGPVPDPRLKHASAAASSTSLYAKILQRSNAFDHCGVVTPLVSSTADMIGSSALVSKGFNESDNNEENAEVSSSSDAHLRTLPTAATPSPLLLPLPEFATHSLNARRVPLSVTQLNAKSCVHIPTAIPASAQLPANNSAPVRQTSGGHLTSPTKTSSLLSPLSVSTNASTSIGASAHETPASSPAGTMRKPSLDSSNGHLASTQNLNNIASLNGNYTVVNSVVKKEVPIPMDTSTESASGAENFDERVRALDEKFNAWQGSNVAVAHSVTSSGIRSALSSSSSSHGTSTPGGALSCTTPIGGTPTLPQPPTIDYSKYQIKRKSETGDTPISGVPSAIGDHNAAEIRRAVLAKTSIFDQDSKRLELMTSVPSSAPITGIAKPVFRTKAAAKEFDNAASASIGETGLTADRSRSGSGSSTGGLVSHRKPSVDSSLLSATKQRSESQSSNGPNLVAPSSGSLSSSAGAKYQSGPSNCVHPVMSSMTPPGTRPEATNSSSTTSSVHSNNGNHSSSTSSSSTLLGNSISMTKASREHPTPTPLSIPAQTSSQRAPGGNSGSSSLSTPSKGSSSSSTTTTSSSSRDHLHQRDPLRSVSQTPTLSSTNKGTESSSKLTGSATASVSHQSCTPQAQQRVDGSQAHSVKTASKNQDGAGALVTKSGTIPLNSDSINAQKQHTHSSTVKNEPLPSASSSSKATTLTSCSSTTSVPPTPSTAGSGTTPPTSASSIDATSCLDADPWAPKLTYTDPFALIRAAKASAASNEAKKEKEKNEKEREKEKTVSSTSKDSKSHSVTLKQQDSTRGRERERERERSDREREREREKDNHNAAVKSNSNLHSSAELNSKLSSSKTGGPQSDSKTKLHSSSSGSFSSGAPAASKSERDRDSRLKSSEDEASTKVYKDGKTGRLNSPQKTTHKLDNASRDRERERERERETSVGKADKKSKLSLPASSKDEPKVNSYLSSKEKEKSGKGSTSDDRKASSSSVKSSDRDVKDRDRDRADRSERSSSDKFSGKSSLSTVNKKDLSVKDARDADKVRSSVESKPKSSSSGITSSSRKLTSGSRDRSTSSSSVGSRIAASERDQHKSANDRFDKLVKGSDKRSNSEKDKSADKVRSSSLTSANNNKLHSKDSDDKKNLKSKSSASSSASKVADKHNIKSSNRDDHKKDKDREDEKTSKSSDKTDRERAKLKANREQERQRFKDDDHEERCNKSKRSSTSTKDKMALKRDTKRKRKSSSASAASVAAAQRSSMHSELAKLGLSDADIYSMGYISMYDAVKSRSAKRECTLKDSVKEQEMRNKLHEMQQQQRDQAKKRSDSTSDSDDSSRDDDDDDSDRKPRRRSVVRSSDDEDDDNDDSRDVAKKEKGGKSRGRSTSKTRDSDDEDAEDSSRSARPSFSKQSNAAKLKAGPVKKSCKASNLAANKQQKRSARALSSDEDENISEDSDVNERVVPKTGRATKAPVDSDASGESSAESDVQQPSSSRVAKSTKSKKVLSQSNKMASTKSKSSPSKQLSVQKSNNKSKTSSAARLDRRSSSASSRLSSSDSDVPFCSSSDKNKDVPTKRRVNKLNSDDDESPLEKMDADSDDDSDNVKPPINRSTNNKNLKAAKLDKENTLKKKAPLSANRPVVSPISSVSSDSEPDRKRTFQSSSAANRKKPVPPVKSSSLSARAAALMAASSDSDLSDVKSPPSKKPRISQTASSASQKKISPVTKPSTAAAAAARPTLSAQFSSLSSADDSDEAKKVVPKKKAKLEPTKSTASNKGAPKVSPVSSSSSESSSESPASDSDNENRNPTPKKISTATKGLMQKKTPTPAAKKEGLSKKPLSSMGVSSRPFRDISSDSDRGILPSLSSSSDDDSEPDVKSSSIISTTVSTKKTTTPSSSGPITTPGASSGIFSQTEWEKCESGSAATITLHGAGKMAQLLVTDKNYHNKQQKLEGGVLSPKSRNAEMDRNNAAPHSKSASSSSVLIDVSHSGIDRQKSSSSKASSSWDAAASSTTGKRKPSEAHAHSSLTSPSAATHLLPSIGSAPISISQTHSATKSTSGSPSQETSAEKLNRKSQFNNEASAAASMSKLKCSSSYSLPNKNNTKSTTSSSSSFGKESTTMKPNNNSHDSLLMMSSNEAVNRDKAHNDAHKWKARTASMDLTNEQHNKRQYASNERNNGTGNGAMAQHQHHAKYTSSNNATEPIRTEVSPKFPIAGPVLGPATEQSARKFEDLLRDFEENVARQEEEEAARAALTAIATAKEKERRLDEEAAIETQRLELELKGMSSIETRRPSVDMLHGHHTSAASLYSHMAVKDDPATLLSHHAHPQVTVASLSTSRHPHLQPTTSEALFDSLKLSLGDASSKGSALDKSSNEPKEEEERHMEDDLAVSSILQEMSSFGEPIVKSHGPVEEYTVSDAEQDEAVNNLSAYGYDPDEEPPLQIAEPSPGALSDDAELRSLTEEVAERINTMQEKDEDSQEDDTAPAIGVKPVQYKPKTHADEDSRGSSTAMSFRSPSRSDPTGSGSIVGSPPRSDLLFMRSPPPQLTPHDSHIHHHGALHLETGHASHVQVSTSLTRMSSPKVSPVIIPTSLPHGHQLNENLPSSSSANVAPLLMHISPRTSEPLVPTSSAEISSYAHVDSSQASHASTEEDSQNENETRSENDELSAAEGPLGASGLSSERPRRGRRAKTKKYSESSLQLPRYEGAPTGDVNQALSEPKELRARGKAPQGQAIGAPSSHPAAALSEQRPRRSTRRDANSDATGANDEAKSGAESASRDAFESSEPNVPQDSESNVAVAEPKKRGRKKKVSVIEQQAQAVPSIVSETIGLDGKPIKERITISLPLPAGLHQVQHQHDSKPSAYDIFEFRDSDEDEDGDERPLGLHHEKPADGKAPPAPQPGGLAAQVSASAPLQLTESKPLLDETSESNDDIRPDMTASAADNAAQSNKYVTELQHGKLAITIKIAKDLHGATAAAASSLPTELEMQQAQRPKTSGDESSVDESPAKATRKSARLQSIQTIKTNSIDDAIDNVIGGVKKRADGTIISVDETAGLQPGLVPLSSTAVSSDAATPTLGGISSTGRTRRTRASRRSEEASVDGQLGMHDDESQDGNISANLSETDSTSQDHLNISSNSTVRETRTRTGRVTRALARSGVTPSLTDAEQSNESTEPRPTVPVLKVDMTKVNAVARARSADKNKHNDGSEAEQAPYLPSTKTPVIHIKPIEPQQVSPTTPTASSQVPSSQITLAASDSVLPLTPITPATPIAQQLASSAQTPSTASSASSFDSFHGPRFHPSNTAMKLKSGKAYLAENPDIYRVAPIAAQATQITGPSKTATPATPAPVQISPRPSVPPVLVTSDSVSPLHSSAQQLDRPSVVTMHSSTASALHSPPIRPSDSARGTPTSIISSVGLGTKPTPSPSHTPSPGIASFAGQDGASLVNSQRGTPSMSNTPHSMSDLLSSRQRSTLTPQPQLGYRASPAPPPTPPVSVVTSMASSPYATALAAAASSSSGAVSPFGIGSSQQASQAAMLPPGLPREYYAHHLAMQLDPSYRAQYLASSAAAAAAQGLFRPGYPMTPAEMELARRTLEQQHQKDTIRERRPSQEKGGLDDKLLRPLQIHPAIPQHMRDLAMASSPGARLTESPAAYIHQMPGLKQSGPLSQATVPGSMMDFRQASAHSPSIMRGTPGVTSSTLSGAIRPSLPSPYAASTSSSGPAKGPIVSTASSSSSANPFMSFASPSGSVGSNSSSATAADGSQQQQQTSLSGLLAHYSQYGPSAPTPSVPAGLPLPIPLKESSVLQHPEVLKHFPPIWQGQLSLKNDHACVQMHFLSGNMNLISQALPPLNTVTDPYPQLKISQRMRLEPTHIDGVIGRIQVPENHCTMIAVPTGRDRIDIEIQARNLKTGFVNYLSEKQAAGIVNTSSPTTQLPYIVHIFPPCDFSWSNMQQTSPELTRYIQETNVEHLVIIVVVQ